MQISAPSLIFQLCKSDKVLCVIDSSQDAEARNKNDVSSGGMDGLDEGSPSNGPCVECLVLRRWIKPVRSVHVLRALT